MKYDASNEIVFTVQTMLANNRRPLKRPPAIGVDPHDTGAVSILLAPALFAVAGIAALLLMVL